jgi:hypothetical protein
VSVGYTLGMTVSPVEGTNIAFSYRSQVEHKITDGKADFTIRECGGLPGHCCPGYLHRQQRSRDHHPAGQRHRGLHPPCERPVADHG